MQAGGSSVAFHNPWPEEKPSGQGSTAPPAGPAIYAPPPSDASSPSSASGTKKTGIMHKLTTPDLLDPPPPSFGRPPPTQPYPPFAPCALESKGSSLRKGFPLAPPASGTQPHPFATHDVAEADWARFVGDVQRAAKLSIAEHVVAGAVPALLGLTIIGGEWRGVSAHRRRAEWGVHSRCRLAGHRVWHAP